MNTRVSPQRSTMRKAPRQQRSRATVDTILDAATRVLALRGWARFTTNEVAVVAGVSIGSLYQYFPDKLSLAEAIRQRHLDAVLAALPQSDHPDDTSTLVQRVERLIDGVIAAHSLNQALHRVLLDEVPLADRSSYEAFEMEYQRRYQALIMASSGRCGGDRNDVAARVLAAAVEGVVHNAARFGELRSLELKTELTDLICAYLQHRRDAGEIAVGAPNPAL